MWTCHWDSQNPTVTKKITCNFTTTTQKCWPQETLSPSIMLGSITPSHHSDRFSNSWRQLHAAVESKPATEMQQNENE